MDTTTLIAEAKARFSHNSAKAYLKDKYDSKLIIAEQGGLWRANQQTISFLNSMSSDNFVILVDTFDNPVQVDREKLLTILKDTYNTVMLEWYKEWKELEGKKMSKGALLFAFNSPKYNYYEMAVATAKRINHFLDLPVTVITDDNSIPNNIDYTFDNTITITPDKSNRRDWGVWINKGRYQAFELSPYDETLLLDTDYMVNSNKLLKTFDLPTDFCCHDTTSFLMHPGVPQEMLSVYSFNTLWATVVNFKRTKRAEQIFDCLKLIQNNFEHYANIHGFISVTFRNDYALTLATRIANGHIMPIEDIIPWNLVHVGKNTSVHRNNDDEFNTEYTVMFDNWQRGKIRKEYNTIKDTDFHVMNKENFMELIA